MSDLSQQLKKHFGFDAFREGQEAVISRLLAGKSTLAIFPTAGGKSICYQLPALVLDGLTVVISPLIALMKDQFDFLIGKGISAARLDSTLTREENLKLFDDLSAGTLKLLYISPERLGKERFLRALGRQRISLLAIDEAHENTVINSNLFNGGLEMSKTVIHALKARWIVWPGDGSFSMD